MAETPKGLVFQPVKEVEQDQNNQRILNLIMRLQSRIIRKAGAPGVGDDEQDGYENGTLWINSSTNNVYCLADNTPGAAVWRLLN